MTAPGGSPREDFLPHELLLLRLGSFLSAGVRTPDALRDDGSEAPDYPLLLAHASNRLTRTHILRADLG